MFGLNKMKILTELILARLEVTAMKSYRAKTAQQLKPKNDASHRMMRQAYKRRTSTDKTTDHKHDVLYYRKNKSQLKQRRLQSIKRHPKPTPHAAGLTPPTDYDYGYYSYEYRWLDGLTYSIVLYGTAAQTQAHATRLSLAYGGKLIGVFDAPNEIQLPSLPDSSIPQVHETFKEHSDYKTCAVYAGRASVAYSLGRKSS